MQSRRMVIGEVVRFPALGKALYLSGPKRAVTAMAVVLKNVADRGLLCIEYAPAAAAQLNWLIMAGPANDAMLLGEAGIPTSSALRRHASEAVEVFLAAYSNRQAI